MSILILNLSPRRLGTSALLGRLMQEQLGEQTQLWSSLDIEAAWDSFLEGRAVEKQICICNRTGWNAIHSYASLLYRQYRAVCKGDAATLDGRLDYRGRGNH